MAKHMKEEEEDNDAMKKKWFIDHVVNSGFASRWADDVIASAMTEEGEANKGKNVMSSHPKKRIQLEFAVDDTGRFCLKEKRKTKWSKDMMFLRVQLVKLWVTKTRQVDTISWNARHGRH